MTEEHKEQIVATLKLLFFPITGFYFICKECKDLHPSDFLTEWFHYMLGVILWAAVSFGFGFIVWGLIYHLDKVIIPIGLFGGVIFFFFILPIILHKILNRK